MVYQGGRVKGNKRVGYLFFSNWFKKNKLVQKCIYLVKKKYLKFDNF